MFKKSEKVNEHDIKLAKEVISQIAHQQNEILLSAIQYELQQEKEREQVLINLNYPIEKKRMKLIFQQERINSSQKIEQMIQDHQSTLENQ